MKEICTNEIKCYKKNKRHRVRTFLSLDEVDRLASACIKLPRNVTRNRAIVWTLFWFGLRTSELISLRWSDIDLKKGEVIVNRLKNSKNSLQPIPCTKYKRLMMAYQRDCFKKGFTDHVFCTQTGNPFVRLTIHHLIRRLGELANLSFVIYPHMLRHSLGYFLANNNVPTHTIQMHLGHVSITNTVRYIEMDSNVYKKTWQMLRVR